LLPVPAAELKWEEIPVPQPHAAMAIQANVLRIRVRITAAIAGFRSIPADTAARAGVTGADRIATGNTRAEAVVVLGTSG
jgi:hypothetical protein